MVDQAFPNYALLAHMLRIIPFQDIMQGRGAHLRDLYEYPIQFQVEFEQVQLALPLSLLRLDLLLGLLVIGIRCKLCFPCQESFRCRSS